MRLAISENYIRKNWDRHYGDHLISSCFVEVDQLMRDHLRGYRPDRRVPLAEIARVLLTSEVTYSALRVMDSLADAMCLDMRLPRKVRLAAKLVYGWDLGKAQARIDNSNVGDRFRRSRALFFRVIRRAEERFLGEGK